MENYEREEKILWDYIDLMQKVGLSRSTAYNFLHRADMPVVKIGGRRYMNSALFRQWLDAHTQTTNA